jgi:hypothetical protein
MYNNYHRFIFLHAGKCAGTSIKDALNDLVIEPNQLTSGHPTLSQCQEAIEKQGLQFGQYYIFSITRNPWDRMVSWYYHALNTTASFSGSFDDFVCKRLIEKNENLLPPYDVCDFVIEFDNLQEDFSKVLNKLGFDSTQLPHRNHNSKRPKRNYQDYYSEKSKSIVQDYFSEIIIKFNYSF